MSKYRVRRSVVWTFPPYDEDPPHTVWEGDNLAKYKGGLGAFEEADYQSTIWVEKNIDGEWVEISVDRGSNREYVEVKDLVIEVGEGVYLGVGPDGGIRAYFDAKAPEVLAFSNYKDSGKAIDRIQKALGRNLKYRTISKGGKIAVRGY